MLYFKTIQKSVCNLKLLLLQAFGSNKFLEKSGILYYWYVKTRSLKLITNAKRFLYWCISRSYQLAKILTWAAALWSVHVGDDHL